MVRTGHPYRGAAALCGVALAASAVLGGCAGTGTPAGSIVPIDVWVNSGSDAELATMTGQVKAFNAARRGEVNARLRVIPEGDYNDVLQAAVAADTLPDVVNIDGPMLASLHFQGALADLTELLPPQTIDALLPSLLVQGTIEGELVGAGAFDSGLGLFGNRRLLEAAGVDYPVALEDGWTVEQFEGALAALAAMDPDGLVLDLKRNYGAGEWLTYGFAPLLWSAGGDLVDRESGVAAGVLDGQASVGAMTHLGQWSARVDPNADDLAFAGGRVALSWVGHWAYPDYAEALGADLIVLPLPDLGLGTKTGQGSWTWSVGSASTHPAEAGAFVDFLLSSAEVERTSTANGAVPGRRDVLASSALYGSGGALERLGRQLSQTCGAGPIEATCIAVSRPLTAGYPAISASASRAIAAVLDGADPQQALTDAADAIDADLAANEGY